MKKNIFLFLLLAIISMSCQKDINPSVSTSDLTPTNAKVESIFDQAKPQANDDVYAKIEAFKTKLAKIEQGSMPETDNGTTVSDAIWNIEALLNSRYARASQPFEDLKWANNTIRVALNDDGTINNSALLTAVEQTRQQLNNQFQAISETDKHVVAIDIRKKVPQVELETSILLEVEGVYGLKPKRPVTPFGPNDFWHWGAELGTCLGPPTQQPKDAAVKLGEKLNYRTVWETDVYYTHIQTEFLWTTNLINPNDVTPDDNIRDFLVFKQLPSLPNYNLLACLSPSDMNFYLAGGRIAINSMQPVGKNFISINIFGDATNISTTPPILHRGEVQYGIPHWINTPL
jgi:hypothetical protein